MKVKNVIGTTLSIEVVREVLNRISRAAKKDGWKVFNQLYDSRYNPQVEGVEYATLIGNWGGCWTISIRDTRGFSTFVDMDHQITPDNLAEIDIAA